MYEVVPCKHGVKGWRPQMESREMYEVVPCKHGVKKGWSSQMKLEGGRRCTRSSPASTESKNGGHKWSRRRFTRSSLVSTEFKDGVTNGVEGDVRGRPL
eukprot:scaffold147208_cov18-Tisochrysis_lutea.AAC.1